MDKRNKFRDLIKYRAGALCLVGILTATYMHTTTFMSTFFYGSLILGGIAALAIDSGVVAMSIFKDELLRDGELAWMVRLVTSVVLFASGVANMSEGFKSAYGIQLTWDSLMALDPLTWTQWVAGTVVFPILAYVMTDTIGTRNLQELHRQQKESQGRIEYTNGIVSNQPISLAQKTAFIMSAAEGWNPEQTQSVEEKISRRNEFLQLELQQQNKLIHDFADRYPGYSDNEIAQYFGVGVARVTAALYNGNNVVKN